MPLSVLVQRVVDDLTRGEVERGLLGLAALITLVVQGGDGGNAGIALEPQGEQLLTVQEAAQRLRTTPDWLYRHWRDLPFALRVGRHVRFRARELDAWIASGSDRSKTD